MLAPKKLDRKFNGKGIGTVEKIVFYLCISILCLGIIMFCNIGGEEWRNILLILVKWI